MAERLTASLLITGIGTLATPTSGDAPKRGAEMSGLAILHDVVVAIDDETIVAVGTYDEVMKAVDAEGTEQVDAQGGLVIPGRIDCHTHAVFAGSRADEHEIRNLGGDYEAIHAAGGGIKRTVAATRAALADETITDLVYARLQKMLREGTTTAEVKSGYGLSIEDEWGMLCVINELSSLDDVPTLLATVLAAHTVPAEYAGRADDYITEVAIPAVEQASAMAVAQQADIFLETSGFNLEQTRTYLEAAAHAGLGLRMHSDQFSDLGGITLARELGVRSVDHCEAITESGIAQLTEDDAPVAVLLPISSLFLNRQYAPGRTMIDRGAAVAVASDYNPGSSHSHSMQLATSLAAVGCGLSAAELITASSFNAAWVLDMHRWVGVLEPGYRADLLLCAASDIRELPYAFDQSPIEIVVSRGRQVPPAAVQ